MKWAVHKSRAAEGGGGGVKTSRNKVNRMELLICHIFGQLSISSTKNIFYLNIIIHIFPL